MYFSRGIQAFSIICFFWTMALAITFSSERERQEQVFESTEKTSASLVAPTATPQRRTSLKQNPQGRELLIVRSCSGGIVENEEDGTRLARFTAFFKSQKAPPKIIRAVVKGLSSSNSSTQSLSTYHFTDLNRTSVEADGTMAEHGSLTELAFYDSQNNETRLPDLLDEAADLCLSRNLTESQFLIEAENFTNSIREEAQAYITMDLQVPDRDAKISIYYELDGELLQSDFKIGISQG